MANDALATQAFDAVNATFPASLASQIVDAVNHDPKYQQLFLDISRYVASQQQPNSTPQELPSNPKKRKLDNGSEIKHEQTNGSSGPISVIAFECRDVSVQIPARKKLKVTFARDAQDQSAPEIRLINPSTDAPEFGLPVDQIEEVFTMPVPDKAARQTYFGIVPKLGAVSTTGAPVEQILFTLADSSPSSSVAKPYGAITEDDTQVSLTEKALGALLAPYGKHITKPKAAEFASSRPQPHRKGERGYHVNAYRGSKEGIFILTITTFY